MRFPTGRKRVTCRVLKQSNLGKQTTWTSDSHVVAANLCQASSTYFGLAMAAQFILFFSWKVKQNSKWLFPRESRCFFWEKVIKIFINTSSFFALRVIKEQPDQVVKKARVDCR